MSLKKCNHIRETRIMTDAWESTKLEYDFRANGNMIFNYRSNRSILNNIRCGETTAYPVVIKRDECSSNGFRRSPSVRRIRRNV